MKRRGLKLECDPSVELEAQKANTFETNTEGQAKKSKKGST